MLVVGLALAGVRAAAQGQNVPNPAGTITAWGKPSGGLQAGIRCPKDKQVLGPGQEVELEVVVRNVSDKPIEFIYLPPTRFWGTAEKSTVVVTCMHMAHGSPRSDGLGFANKATIHPGKELLLGGFSLGHIRPKGRGAASAPRPELAPGKYQVGSENVLVPLKGDESDWKLPTGYLDIELLPAREERAPDKSDQPTSAPTEQKVLTAAEAIAQRPKEKVTVQFKVTAVQDESRSPGGGFGVGFILLKDGGSFSVRLDPPAMYTIMRLDIEPEKYFMGKVVRVTGLVQPDREGRSFHIRVEDLTHFLVMKEQAAEQPQAKKEQPAANKDQSQKANKEPDVLTPAEAIKQKDQEQVTVQFEVAAVKMGWSTGVVPKGSKSSPVWWELKDGNNFSVVLKGRVAYRLEQLHIDTVTHFTGKVVRVTGRIQGKEPSLSIKVDDLDQLEIVR